VRRRGRDVHLGPGDLWFGAGGHRVHTLLGSCVAITVWHPGRRLGGMCHFVVPSRGGPVGGGPLNGWYGDEAACILRTRMHEAGTEPGQYAAEIFGAGSQFAMDSLASRSEVPQRNYEAGLGALRWLGLVPRVEHTGGSGPRQVTLDLASGEVVVRHTPLLAQAGSR